MARRRRRAFLKRVRDRMLRIFTCGHRRLDDNDGDDSYLAKASPSTSSQNGEVVERVGSSLETHTQSLQSAFVGECPSTQACSGEPLETKASPKSIMEAENTVENHRDTTEYVVSLWENPIKSPKISRERIPKWEMDVKRDLQEVEDCSRIDFQSLVKMCEGEKLKIVVERGVIKVEPTVPAQDHAERETVEKLVRIETTVATTDRAAVENTIEIKPTAAESNHAEKVQIEKVVDDEGTVATPNGAEVEDSNDHLETNALEENVDGKSLVESFATEIVEGALETAIEQVKVKERWIQEAAKLMVSTAIDNAQLGIEEERVKEEVITNEARGLVGCVLTNVETELQEEALREQEVSSEAKGLVSCVLSNVSHEAEFQEQTFTEEEISTDAKGLIDCVLCNVSQEAEFQEQTFTEKEVSNDAKGLIDCVLSNVSQEAEFQEQTFTEEEVSTDTEGLIDCVLSNVSQKTEVQEQTFTEEDVSTDAKGLIDCVMNNVAQEAEFQGQAVDPMKITEEQTLLDDERVIKIHYVDDKSTIDEDVVEDGTRHGTAAVSTLSQIGETNVVNQVTDVVREVNCTTKASCSETPADFESVASEANVRNNLVVKSLHSKIFQLTYSEKRLDTETTPKNRGLGKIPSGKVESLIRKFSVQGN